MKRIEPRPRRHVKIVKKTEPKQKHKLFQCKQKKKTEKEPKQKKLDLVTICVLIVMMIGWYVLTFPTSANLINKIYNVNTISSYQSDLQDYSDEDLQKMIADCQTYNAKIYEEQQKTEFKYRGSSASDEEYESLPMKTTMIATLYVPKLGINVSVGHGTNDTLLQGSAGHLYGTSLPVEGENVHSVIAAHSALASAELFTHLNRLVKDDIFYVTVLNQKYEYKVVDINTVLPEDDYEYEQVEAGKNYVTLYTCTPYGINTHRLLVKGEFVGVEKVELNGDFKLTIWGDLATYSSELALIILAPFIVVLIYNIVDYNTTRKKKKKKRASKNQQV